MAGSWLYCADSQGRFDADPKCNCSISSGTQHRSLRGRFPRVDLFGPGAGAGVEPAAGRKQARRRDSGPARVRDGPVRRDLRRRVRLHVLVDKKVRMITTAADVVHSWWVPAFGAKQDAIPGFLRDTWFRAEKTGVFRGQCAELCGKEHGFMPIVVRVVSQEDYSKWVGERKKALLAQADDPNRKWSLEELKARGEKVYAANCVACHQASGKGLPPAFPPLDGSKIATGAKPEHIDMVLNGKPNTAMAAFGKQLSDTEIAAVITYERNSWGNKAGEVQPAEVKARRK